MWSLIFPFLVGSGFSIRRLFVCEYFNSEWIIVCWIVDRGAQSRPGARLPRVLWAPRQSGQSGAVYRFVHPAHRHGHRTRVGSDPQSYGQDSESAHPEHDGRSQPSRRRHGHFKRTIGPWQFYLDEGTWLHSPLHQFPSRIHCFISSWNSFRIAEWFWKNSRLRWSKRSACSCKATVSVRKLIFF